MAGPRVSQSSDHSRWKQWWRRSPNTCCSKKILLLLMWQTFFTLSSGILSFVPTHNKIVLVTSMFFSYFFAPLIGWLADVRFGRYETIKFVSFTSFLASILYFFTMITGRGYTTLSTALLSLAIVINNFGFICYATAMLPFITDQIIGATSEELSAVVRWNYWAENLGIGFSDVVTVFCRRNRLKNLYIKFNFALCCSSCCDHHQ